MIVVRVDAVPADLLVRPRFPRNTPDFGSADMIVKCSLGLVAALTVSLALTSCSTTPPPTAEAVVADLSSAVPSMRPGEPVTADSDPNQLLGRPGGYTSAMPFTDSRVPAEPLSPEPGSVAAGGKVEVFESAEDAQRRFEYVQTVTRSAPIFGEYTYLSGPVVLRVARGLTPDQASEYEAALTE